MSYEINDDILARIPPEQLLEELHRRQDQVKKDSAEKQPEDFLWAHGELSGPQPPAAQPDEEAATPDRWSWIGYDGKPYSVRVRGEAVYLLQPERQYEKIFAIFTTNQFQAILGGLGDYGPYLFTSVNRGFEVKFTRAVARSRTTSEFFIPNDTLNQVKKFFL
jgi:hypothetical protein